MNAQRLILTVLVAMAPGALGCGAGLYELPDPPPREAWRRHSLNPALDDDRSREDFLEAQDAIISFVEAMKDHRFDEAYELLSNETRILLDDLSPSGRGEAVLESGDIERADASYHVDPLDLLVVRNLDRITDSHDDQPESETYRRKEVYAISAEGDVHHVVLIREANIWRIHKPEIDLTPGAPGRRADI